MKSSRTSKVFNFVLSSAFLGGLISTLIAPRLITWYTKPAINMGIDCSTTAEWATHTLLKWQLIGSAVGIILGLILMFWLLRRESKEEI